MAECPTACPTVPKQTESFAKILSAITKELEQRDIPGIEDLHELSMALSVLVADSLGIDIYQ